METSTTCEFYYLDGNIIAVRKNGTEKNYLAFTDNLGSILSVMDEDGTKVFDASYDAPLMELVFCKGKLISKRMISYLSRGHSPADHLQV